MRRLVILLALLLFVSPVAASSSLEGQIQAVTGIVRPVDASLQARAAVRAVQIQTTFGHCCLAPNEAEIIGWDAGFADPLGQLVLGWVNSPKHAAILFDPGWHNIGCAVAVSGTRTYGVCIFAAGPAIRSQPKVQPAPPIPNTSMAGGER